MTRTKKTIETITCDACGKEIKDQDWYPKLELTKHDEEFLVLEDLDDSCYHDIWNVIDNLLKKIRGEANDKTGISERQKVFSKD